MAVTYEVRFQTVPPARRGEYVKMYKQAIQEIKQAGCRGGLILCSEDDPASVLVLLEWESKEHHQRWRGTPLSTWKCCWAILSVNGSIMYSRLDNCAIARDTSGSWTGSWSQKYLLAGNAVEPNRSLTPRQPQNKSLTVISCARTIARSRQYL